MKLRTLPQPFADSAKTVLAGSIAALLTCASSTTLHAAGLTASDGATDDRFGRSVGQSGSIGLAGAYQDDIGANADQGSAYVFRSLDTATGTITQNVKLTASDGAADDAFGVGVSLSGSIGLVGAYFDNIGASTGQGSAYVFRSLDTATGTITQNVKLTASDGGADDNFGIDVSLSGSIGLVGAYLDNFGAGSTDQGSAYVFRNLDTATGTITQNAKLTASDGGADDRLGVSVSLSGSIGLLGANGDNIAGNANQGSAYVFRSLDTATGTITQNVKLTASDGAANDGLGVSVSLSGAIGLAGSWADNIGSNIDQGSAYVFRNLDTATGTITENVKLTASDGAAGDNFGWSVSQSGGIGLIGAIEDDIGANTDQGSAYLFRDLDTATGTITHNVKLTASDGAAGDAFGVDVDLDGDQFVIGARGRNSGTGKAYSGSVSSVTTLDAGSTSKTISGLSFVSQDDWIIGETTDSNQVTLSAGDTANVTAAGKVVSIGQNAGSDNNTLVIAGTLTATQINVGATGNTGNVLQVGNGGTTGTLSTASVITNHGSVIFNRSVATTQGTHFGSAAIAGTGSLTQAGSGTTTFNAANTYTGGTLVNAGTLEAAAAGALGGTSGITVNTGGTLLLSGATTDRINNAATVTLAGGKIAFSGNVTEGPSSPGTGALTLAANSIIDFGGGNDVINFGASNLVSWNPGGPLPTLSIWNWLGSLIGGGNDQLKFGINSNSLTFSQLGQISFYSGPGTGFLGTGKFVGSVGEVVPVPEPSSVFIGIALVGLAGWREGRREEKARRSARRR